MQPEKRNILVVDDNPPICNMLSLILDGSGYRVRLAKDGFSALAELRNEIPDILISDLYMPGMSGFEFLSVIRIRFPEIPVVAMSGAYSGSGIPPGVAADAFYEKGTSTRSLLRVVEAMTQPHQGLLPQYPRTLAPVWIPRNEFDYCGEPYATITCPECLRAFAKRLADAVEPVRETDCVYCGSPISYAIFQPADQSTPQIFQRHAGTGAFTPLSLPNFT